jgi:hypothetical protein
MMESPGDAYAVIVRDDRLRAGWVAADPGAQRDRRARAGAARAALAAGLRALAALVDPPRPAAPAPRGAPAAEA